MAKKKTAPKAPRKSQFDPQLIEREAIADGGSETDAHKLERLSRWQATMLQQMEAIDDQAKVVSELAAELDGLKVKHGEAKNLHSGLVAELTNMARDFAKGQERFQFEDERAEGANRPQLPFDDDESSGMDGAMMTIDCLSQTAMRKFHAEEFSASKKRDEPIGLAADKLGVLKEAGIKRIGDLEAEMRANPERWGQKFGLTPHQQTIANNTLAVFRRKYPHRDEDEGDAAVPVWQATIDEVAGYIGQARELVNQGHKEQFRLVQLVEMFEDLQAIIRKADDVPAATRKSIDGFAKELSGLAAA